MVSPPEDFPKLPIKLLKNGAIIDVRGRLVGRIHLASKSVVRAAFEGVRKHLEQSQSMPWEQS